MGQAHAGLDCFVGYSCSTLKSNGFLQQAESSRTPSIQRTQAKLGAASNVLSLGLQTSKLPVVCKTEASASFWSMIHDYILQYCLQTSMRPNHFITVVFVFLYMFSFAFGPRVCPGQNALRFWKEISYDEVFKGLVLDPEPALGITMDCRGDFAHWNSVSMFESDTAWRCLYTAVLLALFLKTFVGGRQSTCCRLQRDAWFGSIPTNMEIPCCAFESGGQAAMKEYDKATRQ